MNGVLKKLLGDPQAKTIKRLRKRVEAVNALAPKYEKLSDKKLQAQVGILKKRLEKESLDAILPDMFALVRESASRVLGMRHFDVQLIGRNENR
jgi:preprotein translocase subunit SecA